MDVRKFHQLLLHRRLSGWILILCLILFASGFFTSAAPPEPEQVSSLGPEKIYSVADGLELYAIGRQAEDHETIFRLMLFLYGEPIFNHLIMILQMLSVAAGKHPSSLRVIERLSLMRRKMMFYKFNMSNYKDITAVFS